jgi:hypothetical protein
MEATSRAKSVIYWTVDEVTYWMEAMGFDKFVVEEVKAQMVDGAGLVTLVNGAKLDSIGLCSKLKTQQLVWNLERKVERGDVTLKNALQLTNIQTQLRGGKLPKPRKGANRRAKQFNLIDLGDGEEGAVDVKEDGGEEEGEDEDDYDEDDEESDGERGNESAPAPLEFEVVFDADNPPNILLEEFQPGSRLVSRPARMRALICSPINVGRSPHRWLGASQESRMGAWGLPRNQEILRRAISSWRRMTFCSMDFNSELR